MTTDPHTSARPSWMNFHTLAPVIGSLITAAAILTSAIISTRSSSGSTDATLVAVSVAAPPIESLAAVTTVPPNSIAALWTGPIQTVVRTVLVPGPSAAPQVIVITVPTDLRPLPALTGVETIATVPASIVTPAPSTLVTIAASTTTSTTGVSTTTSTTSTTIAGSAPTGVLGVAGAAGANPVAVGPSTPAVSGIPGPGGSTTATVAPVPSAPTAATVGLTSTTR